MNFAIELVPSVVVTGVSLRGRAASDIGQNT